MPVHVNREPETFSSYPAEICCICRTPTRFWFLANDVALCGHCSEEVEVEDIPSKREWLNSQGCSLPEDWKPRVETANPHMGSGRTRKPARTLEEQLYASL